MPYIVTVELPGWWRWRRWAAWEQDDLGHRGPVKVARTEDRARWAAIDAADAQLGQL